MDYHRSIDIDNLLSSTWEGTESGETVSIEKGNIFSIFKYPLEGLEAILSLVEKLKSESSYYETSPAIVSMEYIIKDAKRTYERNACSIYVSLNEDCQIPNKRALIQFIHQLVQEIGIKRRIFVGGLDPNSGFMSMAWKINNKDAEEINIRDFHERIGCFIFDLSQEISRLLRKQGFDNYNGLCTVSVCLGKLEIDVRNIEVNDHGQKHNVVANICGKLANQAGHLAKFKTKYRNISEKIKQTEISNPLWILVSGEDRTNFPDVLTSINNSYQYHSITSEVSLFISTDDNYAIGGSKIDVLAIDFDIGNSTESTKATPNTLAFYRASLIRAINGLKPFGVYTGVWAGDGVKIIRFREPHERETDFRYITQKILEKVEQIVNSHLELKSRGSQHYLRVGIDYRRESVSFTNIKLANKWDNPFVDSCRSTALENASKLQSLAKYTEEIAEPYDAIICSNNVAEFLEIKTGLNGTNCCWKLWPCPINTGEHDENLYRYGDVNSLDE